MEVLGITRRRLGRESARLHPTWTDWLKRRPTQTLASEHGGRHRMPGLSSAERGFQSAHDDRGIGVYAAASRANVTPKWEIRRRGREEDDWCYFEDVKRTRVYGWAKVCDRVLRE